MRNPAGLVTFEMLVQNRRLAEAIDTLGVKYSYEAQTLARAMLETWVNARWIRIREPRRRASRFLKFEAIEALKLLDSVPMHERPPVAAARMRLWKRWRRGVRGTFFRDGKWVTTWAVTRESGRRIERRSLEMRLQDVSRDMEATSGRPEIDSANRTTFYFVYRVFSQPPHGTQVGLTPLVAWTRRGPVAHPQPSRLPLLPLEHAAACLLSFIGWAQIDLSRAYESELKALIKENEVLLQRHRRD